MCETCALVGYDVHSEGFPVNGTTTGNQTGANIARLADGRFIVLYQSSDTAGNGIDIRARIFDRDGTATANDFVVSQTTAGDQTAPAILVNSNDTLSLLWQTPDPMLPGNTQLMERSFDLTGIPLGAERQVSASGADGAYSLTQRPNGTIFITYENNGDVFGRTLDANWNPLTAEVQLNTTTTGTQTQSRLVTLANGNILVAFQSNDNADGGGGSGNLIRNRVFSTTGDAWTPVSINGSTNDFVVNTTGAGGQTSERLSRLFDGRILEVWQSDDTGDGSGTAIRARILSATGDPTGAATDFIVETTTTGNQSRPAILAFDDGRRLIYWHSFESSTDTIRGRFVHANGSLDASDFVIANLPDTSAPAFGLALLANQQVVFTYQGVASSDGLGTGIQGAIGTPANLSLNVPFTNPGTSAFDIALPSFDWDQAAAQISRGNAPWNDVLGSTHSLTYSYRATSAGVSYTNGAAGFTQFNAAEIAAAEAAIQLWKDVANITLTRVQDPGSEYSDSGQFLLWNYATATAGSQAANASGFGGATFSAGAWHHFVSLNDDHTSVTTPTFDNDGFRLFLHEIGHALGLSHPGNYNVLPGGTSLAYDGNAVYRQDSDQYTVMSYFDESITHANFVDTFAMTPLLNDIGALQRLYGANAATRVGDTTYGFNSNTGSASYTIGSSSQHAVFAVWDGGGNDTLDFSGYDARQIITLVPEQFSSVGGLEFNVTIARGTVIENAIGGTGADLITGNGANNALSGGAGNDTVLGDAGSDKLNGGAGRDTSTGGVGADIFIFGTDALTDARALVPIFDRVTDYDRGNGSFDILEGDQLDFSALLAAAYNHGSGQAVASLVRAIASGTGANVQIDTDGTANAVTWVTVARLEGVKAFNDVKVVLDSTLPAGAAITVTPALPANTFDGDSHADILWQNDNGMPAVWLMNGTADTFRGPPVANPGPTWHVKEAADFNGDRKADILWQHDSGMPAVWLMDGATDAFRGPPVGNPGPAWHVKAAADFNGDGKADILWQHDDGMPAVWLMDGTTDAFRGPPVANPGSAWQVKAAADFNGDGKADILWQHDDGMPAVWLMDGTTDTFRGPPVANPGPTWHVKAAADFNRDGKADILWQNDNGMPAVWLMDGTTDTFRGPVLANPGPTWHAVDAADYNGDGKADIVWQNDSGAPAVWLMDGAFDTFRGPVLANPGPSWHII